MTTLPPDQPVRSPMASQPTPHLDSLATKLKAAEFAGNPDVEIIHTNTWLFPDLFYGQTAHFEHGAITVDFRDRAKYVGIGYFEDGYRLCCIEKPGLGAVFGSVRDEESAFKVVSALICHDMEAATDAFYSVGGVWAGGNRSTIDIRNQLRSDGSWVSSYRLFGELVRRNESINEELPVVVRLLSSDNQEHRRYGWGILKRYFPTLAGKHPEYDPKCSTETCKAEVKASMFVIEDEMHVETHGKYATFELALKELERRAQIPWDEPPNRAPCTTWKACGRTYVITEYETVGLPWKRIRSIPILEVSSKGMKWADAFRPR